jgi:phosphatidylserine decarboxylase
MGRFNMGSTVILLFTRDAVRWDPAIQPNIGVRMGQKLGEIVRYDAAVSRGE